MVRISRCLAAGLAGLLAMASLAAPGATEARESRAQSLVVSTREIDLGVIGPGEKARAEFQISNAGEGRIRWAIEEPSGWESSTDMGLAGESGSAPTRVDVALSSLKGRPEPGDHPVEIRISSGRNSLVLKRTLAEGPYREALRIESDGGGRTLFLKFSLADAKSRPALEVEPRGVDLGDTEPVKEITRKLRITNGGAGVLRWQASSGGAGSAPALPVTGRTRYVSLYNESLAAGGSYMAPPALKDSLQLAGNWVAERGYPKAAGMGCTLRLQFQGSGAVLFGRRVAEMAELRAAADDLPVREIPLQDLEGDRFEGIAAGDLPEGPHSLHLQVGLGEVILEGFSVTDSRAAAPPSSWVRLTPLSGTTARETDFVTVRMNLSEFKPGIYTDHVTITPNGGTARIPISLNVTGEPASKILPVYRYTRGDDILFTTQPDREDPRYIGAYQRAGLAFRLYGPQTAGTVELYRWYNPTIGDHYYAAERSGGRKNLAGYLFEGAIGNIATIRLPGTKELYRWFNPATNRHFFTTDAAGEGQGKRGYRFEGTVGFVLK
ncbi:MAG: hypothetical protein ACM34C_01935 [Syntrophaceae bacterium]